MWLQATKELLPEILLLRGLTPEPKNTATLQSCTYVVKLGARAETKSCCLAYLLGKEAAWLTTQPAQDRR
jgi:hypothetical protein